MEQKKLWFMVREIRRLRKCAVPSKWTKWKCSSPPSYCSQRCQNDAYLERRKQRKALEKEKICSICGKQFTAKKKDAMYCSNACKQKAYRRKKNVTKIGFAKIGTTEIGN